jgi:hypothetical protein
MTTPTPFIDGYRLIDGTDLNAQLANPVWSTITNLSATVGGTVSTSKKVVSTLTNVTTTGGSGAGITIPEALPGKILVISNNGTLPITVFAEGGSTINGIPGSIGILMQPNTSYMFSAFAVDQWTSLVWASTFAGGLNTQVQYNDNNLLTGDSSFTFNKTSKLVTMNSLATGNTTITSKAAANTPLALVGATNQLGAFISTSTANPIAPQQVQPQYLLKFNTASLDPTVPPLFNHDISSSRWTNGPVGTEVYFNHVYGLGWNYINATRQNTSLPCFGLSFESKFYQNGTFAEEFHLQGETAAGVPSRWFSFFLPTTLGTGQSDCRTTVDRWTLAKEDGSSILEGRFALGGDPFFSMLQGVYFLYNTNDKFTAKQRNAAGTAFLNLPYIDFENRLSMGAGLYVNAPSADTSFGAVNIFTVTTLSAAQTYFYAQTNSTTTGNLNIFDFKNMYCTGQAVYGFGNRGANGTAVFDLTTSVGTGDTIVGIGIEGGVNWSIGVDQSDSSKLKIAADYRAVGAQDKVTLDINGIFTLNDALAFDGVTFAGLPATPVAGMITRVTNSNVTTGRITAAGANDVLAYYQASGTAGWYVLALL